MAELGGEDRLLLQQITAGLKSTSQYLAFFDEDDADGIKRLRSIGRRAGRDLGWKVRTFTTDPRKRDDGRIVVLVVVEESTPLHEQLMKIRGNKLIAKVMEGIGGDHLDPSPRISTR